MKRKIIYGILGLVVIILAVVVISVLSNPLRKSEEDIKTSLLELTPIGTSMDEVIRVVESKYEWNGYIIPTGVPTTESGASFIGEQSIRVTIGEYRNLYKTYVVVWWGFDENSKLIDVYIAKQIVGL